MKGKEYYNKKIKEYEIKLERLKKITLNLGVLRLSIVLVALYTFYFMYKREKSYLEFIFIGIIYILIFSVVAYFHDKKIKEKNKVELFMDINKNGIKRTNGEWRQFKDKGAEFITEEHSFINDLDIFGEGSLFQWINSTRTQFGRKTLANILKLTKMQSKYEIIEKQESIRELCEKVEWRQKLEVESAIRKSSKGDIKELITWATEDSSLNKSVKIIPYVFILITVLAIFLASIGKIPYTYLLLVFMINYLVVKILTRKLSSVVSLFQRYKGDIQACSDILALIENEQFKSNLLSRLKRKLNDNNGISCEREFKSLKNLIDWIGDSSANAYYFFINIILLSDIFILVNLEEWKIKNGKHLEGWLDIIGQFEALSSISNIPFDFEKWTYPIIRDDLAVEGNNIGHPMLGEKSKTNAFSLCKKERVALITGSNMSGKSTFLRTIGLNLVLSYIGSPTYSSNFSCGTFNIYTCMRTKDNLEENISSFYAEILRIKDLIEASNRGEKVFFLLDEIFKGTNSTDRHEGATVLINQLVKLGGIGLVSTHDLELCDLEKEKNWLINYNFQEYYEGNEIKFDYKLRRGRSKTTNAIHLMKLAGIHFE